jgi:hypothetical protein
MTDLGSLKAARDAKSELWHEFEDRARPFTTIVDGRWGVLLRFRPGIHDPAPAYHNGVPVRAERRSK